MADDAWYSPNREPAPPRQPTPGVKVWELRNGDHVARCELRDDERQSAGVDVVLLEDGDVLLSKRCMTADGAR